MMSQFVKKVLLETTDYWKQDRFQDCCKSFGYLKVSKKNFLSNHIITSSSNLDDRLVIFTKNVNEALDDLAPYKTFTVRSQFKFGLTEETKELMSKRDNIRKNLCKASASEKPIMIKQYKKIYF